jgi:general secretion pathway protein C
LDWFGYFHFSLSDFRGLVSRRTLTLMLMAILLYQAVGIFYKVLTIQIVRMKPATAAVIKAPDLVEAVREPLAAYKVIQERNLLGTTNKTFAEIQAEKPVEVKQDVGVLIDLKGTVAGESEYGFAFVEDKKDKKQVLVKVGDMIAGGKVIRINRNSIDLLVGNQERNVKMAEAKESPILPPPAVEAGAQLPSPAADSVALNRSDINAGFQDMGSMLRQAQIRPYFNAGAPDGFMISSIRSGSLYQKMGIANGDIIQGINGNSIRTADDMVKLYNTMKSGSNVALSIKRRGKAETLNYQIQ